MPLWRMTPGHFFDGIRDIDVERHVLYRVHYGVKSHMHVGRHVDVGEGTRHI